MAMTGGGVVNVASSDPSFDRALQIVAIGTKPEEHAAAINRVRGELKKVEDARAELRDEEARLGDLRSELEGTAEAQRNEAGRLTQLEGSLIAREDRLGEERTKFEGERSQANGQIASETERLADERRAFESERDAKEQDLADRESACDRREAEQDDREAVLTRRSDALDIDLADFEARMVQGAKDIAELIAQDPPSRRKGG